MRNSLRLAKAKEKIRKLVAKGKISPQAAGDVLYRLDKPKEKKK